MQRSFRTKAIRDAWGERGRAALVIAALAVGVAAFFAVLATYAILERELNAGYLATNPASAIFITNDIDPALLTNLIARDDVEDAEARRLLRGRIRTAGGGWQRLALFVLSDVDHTRISRVTREHGSNALQAGELLIERDAFQVAHVSVGDRVEVEVNGGNGSRVLRVAGGVHDVGQAQARMENVVYAYITPDTLPLLGHSSSLDRLYVTASGNRFNAEHVKQVAAAVTRWLEQNGHAVTRAIVPTPGEHPHAAIMGLLLLSISLLGLVILGLSATIVFTVTLSTMARQRRQIGVMKAIGGTGRQIAATYLLQAALFGVAAIVVAIPVGLAGSRALTDYLALLLNFDITSYAVPAWVYLLVALVGLAAPVLAALQPVARATAIPVRAALAEHAPNAGDAGFVPVLLARLTGLAPQQRVRGAGLVRPAVLGLQNVFRRPGRAIVTLATMTLAGASFMTAVNMRTSMMAAIDVLFGSGTFGSADRYALDQHMLMIYVFLLIAAGVLGLVGALGMTTVSSLNVLDRTREVGVLRTIGASPAATAVLVLSEAAFVAAGSFVLALLAAWALSALLGKFMTAILFRRGLSVVFSVPGVLAWLSIAVIVSIAANIVPAWRAARRSIREAISYE